MYSFLHLNIIIYIYMLAHTIVLGQLNEYHNVWLLDMIQYGNCRVLKMYIPMRFTHRNSIARGVIVEYNKMRQLYRIKNQFTQVNIGTQYQAK